MPSLATEVGAPAPDPASAAWSALDYLPWDYSPDGCFARSYYVALELAARGIPVSQLIINLRWMSGSTKGPKFAPVDGRRPDTPRVMFHGKAVQWDYHVAALVLPPVVAAPAILDPALESRPVPIETWVHHANSAGVAQSTTDASGVRTPGFDEFTAVGSAYIGVAPPLGSIQKSVTSPDMTSLPPFSAAHVQLACDTIWSVYDCLGAPSGDPRRQRLVDRTSELASKLAEDKRLTGRLPPHVTCKRTAFTCSAL